MTANVFQYFGGLKEGVRFGRKERWKELIPADSAGLNTVNNPVVTPDSKSYAYSYFRALSHLQLVE